MVTWFNAGIAVASQASSANIKRKTEKHVDDGGGDIVDVKTPLKISFPAVKEEKEETPEENMAVSGKKNGEFITGSDVSEMKYTNKVTEEVEFQVNRQNLVHSKFLVGVQGVVLEICSLGLNLQSFCTIWLSATSGN
ncbi:unnamed protein product [Camellia sinensis]